MMQVPDTLNLNRRPVSVRLTVWHSLLFLGSALGLLGFTYALLSNRAYATERDAVEFRLKQYASEYQNGGLNAVRRLASYRKGRAQQAFFVRVADAQNSQIFLRDPDDWAEFAPARLNGQPVPEDDDTAWESLHSPSGGELLLASERLPDGGLLQVGKSTEDLTEVLAEYRRSAFFVLLVFVPASFAGGAFLASRVLRPIKHLTGVAQEIIVTGRFDARVPSPGSRDELDALVHVFNQMLNRIDLLVREMRESIDNVAHDLRTPLTRLQIRAQSALASHLAATSGEPSPNREPMAEALANCVEDAERVATMLNTLMEIAETEKGLTALKRASLDLAPLIAETIGAYSEFADDRGVDIATDISSAFKVNGDSTALSRVFANLFDNAIKYTPRGGRVHIIAALAGPMVEIQFTDTGIGISPDDLPRIWDRLFRSDRSRSERGLGLGLSFVRAIVEAHGGRASARSRRGEGTTVTITLPRV